jgi:hypothetical protein
VSTNGLRRTPGERVHMKTSRNEESVVGITPEFSCVGAGPELSRSRGVARPRLQRFVRPRHANGLQVYSLEYEPMYLLGVLLHFKRRRLEHARVRCAVPECKQSVQLLETLEIVAPQVHSDNE